MVKVFNDSNRKFLLIADDGDQVMISPGKFRDVPDKFQTDITFRTAVGCNELRVYNDVQSAEKMLREHEERPLEAAEAAVTVETAGKRKRKAE